MTSKQLSNAKEEIKMKEAENPVAIYSTAHNAHHFLIKTGKKELQRRAAMITRSPLLTAR